MDIYETFIFGPSGDTYLLSLGGIRIFHISLSFSDIYKPKTMILIIIKMTGRKVIFGCNRTFYIRHLYLKKKKKMRNFYHVHVAVYE